MISLCIYQHTLVIHKLVPTCMHVQVILSERNPIYERKVSTWSSWNLIFKIKIIPIHYKLYFVLIMVIFSYYLKQLVNYSQLKYWKFNIKIIQKMLSRFNENLNKDTDSSSQMCFIVVKIVAVQNWRKYIKILKSDFRFWKCFMTIKILI